MADATAPGDVPPAGDPSKKYDQDFFLALAAKGKDAWNAWRRDPANKDVHVTFVSIDFSEAPRDGIDFSGFEFGDYADFSGCRWRGVRWQEIGENPKAFAPGRACFTGAAFGHRASFTGAAFGGWATLSSATFGGLPMFIGASFGDGAEFSGATFGNVANFGGAIFGDEAQFDGVPSVERPSSRTRPSLMKPSSPARRSDPLQPSTAQPSVRGLISTAPISKALISQESRRSSGPWTLRQIWVGWERGHARR